MQMPLRITAKYCTVTFNREQILFYISDTHQRVTFASVVGAGHNDMLTSLCYDKIL